MRLRKQGCRDTAQSTSINKRNLSNYEPFGVIDPCRIQRYSDAEVFPAMRLEGLGAIFSEKDGGRTAFIVFKDSTDPGDGNAGNGAGQTGSGGSGEE